MQKEAHVKIEVGVVARAEVEVEHWFEARLLGKPAPRYPRDVRQPKATKFGLGNLPPGSVLDMKVQRNCNRAAGTGAKHVGREMNDELVPIEPEQPVR